MAWTGDWRKAAAGGVVLALHALLALYAFHYVFAVPAEVGGKEITLVLLPLPQKPPPAQPDEKKPVVAVHAAPGETHAITIPRDWQSLPQATPQDGAALQGLGASLGCSATNYDALSPAARAACRHGPWKYDAAARETASLIIKAPHVMSAADRAWRIRSTVDPCAAEKLTHQTDCIYKVIYGDKLP